MYSISRILWHHCVTINQQFRANTETEMHICGSPQLHSFRPLNSLNITFKTLTEKHGECIHTAYEALCTLLHAFFYSVRLFLSLLVNGGCTTISISHFPLNSFELVRLICFLFGCLHFLSSLSLFLSLWRPLPPSVRLLSIHSVFKRGRLLRASGDEVSPRLRQPALGLQLLPHVGHRHFHLAPSVCPTGQAGEDERLVSCTQQSLRVDPGEQNLKVSLMVKQIEVLQRITAFVFGSFPGRSGEDKAPDGHHHSGGQRLRGGAVCVGVQSRLQ